MINASMIKVAIGYLFIAGMCIWRLGPLALVFNGAVGGGGLPNGMDGEHGEDQGYSISSHDEGSTAVPESSEDKSPGGLSFGLKTGQYTSNHHYISTSLSNSPASLPKYASTGGMSTFSSSFAAGVPSLLSASPNSGPYFQYSTVYVHDNGLISTVFTPASNVRNALSLANIEVGPADIVAPGVSAPVSPGLHIFIVRAKEVTLDDGGVPKATYTREPNVGALLKEANVTLGPLDRVTPSPEHALRSNMVVNIVRVREDVAVEDESIDYATERRANSEVEVGEQRVIEPGSEGRIKRWVHRRFENDAVVAAIVHKEERTEAKNKIIEYGTKIIVRQLETPLGMVEYGQKIRVYATWYTAGSSGKPINHPGYGITATGLIAGHGVVAVDPSFIPLHTRMYIPGYGMAVAGDTGGGVRGAIIDLGFDDDEPHTWRSGYMDIYIVTS